MRPHQDDSRSPGKARQQGFFSIVFHTDLIYLDAFYWHLDAQSGLAFLFVGIYSLPVMLQLWLAALWKRKNRFNSNDRLTSYSA